MFMLKKRYIKKKKKFKTKNYFNIISNIFLIMKNKKGLYNKKNIRVETFLWNQNGCMFQVLHLI